MEDLPNQCETIIEKDEMFSGIFEVEKNKKTEINFDMINDDKLEAFSRRLADIEVKVADSGGEIPNSLDFFEMHGVGSLREFNVLDRWKKNRTYESMKALIGNPQYRSKSRKNRRSVCNLCCRFLNKVHT